MRNISSSFRVSARSPQISNNSLLRYLTTTVSADATPLPADATSKDSAAPVAPKNLIASEYHSLLFRGRKVMSTIYTHLCI